MTINPDTNAMLVGGIFTKAVDIFKSRVKNITDKAKDIVIITGLRLSCRLPLTDPPIIIGNNGKTHGANTVKNPAINELISSNIFLLLVL